MNAHHKLSRQLKLKISITRFWRAQWVCRECRINDSAKFAFCVSLQR